MENSLKVNSKWNENINKSRTEELSKCLSKFPKEICILIGGYDYTLEGKINFSLECESGVISSFSNNTIAVFTTQDHSSYIFDSYIIKTFDIQNGKYLFDIDIHEPNISPQSIIYLKNGKFLISYNAGYKIIWDGIKNIQLKSLRINSKLIKGDIIKVLTDNNITTQFIIRAHDKILIYSYQHLDNQFTNTINFYNKHTISNIIPISNTKFMITYYTSSNLNFLFVNNRYNTIKIFDIQEKSSYKITFKHHMGEVNILNEVHTDQGIYFSGNIKTEEEKDEDYYEGIGIITSMRCYSYGYIVLYDIKNMRPIYEYLIIERGERSSITKIYPIDVNKVISYSFKNGVRILNIESNTIELNLNQLLNKDLIGFDCLKLPDNNLIISTSTKYNSDILFYDTVSHIITKTISFEDLILSMTLLNNGQIAFNFKNGGIQIFK